MCELISQRWRVGKASPTENRNPIGYSAFLALIISHLTNPLHVQAQITADDSLATTVNSADGVNFTINDGNRSGTNLFHSFNQFSVPSNGSVIFNNDTDITNIFSRVTGENPSSIDGFIQANGTANLFLLNPSGIQFGPNARLEIGGSFMATTANSLIFEDGSLFSTVPTQESPLLTLNMPIGLQFGQNPGPIQVQGTGHDFTINNPVPVFAPINRGNSMGGLSVNPGNTLALVGGDVILAGGSLTAEDGRIEIGSVGMGQVALTPVASGWALDYENVSSFQDIQLSQRAAVDASGPGGGTIQLVGQNITFEEGAVALIQSQGVQPSGSIQVSASESLELSDFLPTAGVWSGLQTESIAGDQPSGDIIVFTKQLVIQEGAVIQSRTFSDASGGSINVNATESLQLIGVSPLNPSIASVIGTSTFAPGQGGDITVSTGQLLAFNGAGVSTSTFGAGLGGDLTVTATESVELIGTDPVSFFPSSISAASGVGGADAGQLTVNTARLVLQDGGRVDSSSFDMGAAGRVLVNASESVEVSGTVPGSSSPSLIISAADILEPAVREFFGAPDQPSSDSGDVVINTPQLTITNGGEISVANEGTGDAGELFVNAEMIVLDRGGQLTASTESGEGGNIALQIQDVLTLRAGSQITAEASGTGNGGNIVIEASAVVAVPSENSDIVANAVAGRGGNIEITTQGLIGLEFQEQLTPESDIVASSEAGVDGVVQIISPEIDPDQGLSELSNTPSDPSNQIATGCAAIVGNAFVITGRGNLPETPSSLGGQLVWDDLRPLETVDQHRFQGQGEIEGLQSLQEHDQILPKMPPPMLTEASRLVINGDGQIQLVAAGPTVDQSTRHEDMCGASLRP